MECDAQIENVLAPESICQTGLMEKKLPVEIRLQDKGIKGTAGWAICGKEEDHAHRLRKHSYLDIPSQMVRGLYTRVKLQDKVLEPSRVCLDNPLELLTTVQGVLLWTAMHALWLSRCDVQFGRQKAGQKGYMAMQC